MTDDIPPERPNPDAEDEIQRLRADIDAVDQQILELINRRLVLAGRIGDVKKQGGRRILDSSREAAVIRRLTALNPGPLSAGDLRHIFIEIISLCRDIQKTLKIAYLGPEASFTHAAALAHFGHFAELKPLCGLQELFGEIEKGAYRYGVVPVEYAVEGVLLHAMDYFLDCDLEICAEVFQTVSYDLVAAGDEPAAIRKIYGRPQAIARCRRWIGENLPWADCEACASAAQAVRLAAAEAGSAAIVGGAVPTAHTLAVLAQGIENRAGNRARFLVIGRDPVPPTGRDKTSLILAVPHAPGALNRVLRPLEEAGINMVKLESRPARHKTWDYTFFVDIEGHRNEPRVAETLEKVRSLSLFLKCVGSYPEAPRD